ncbi:MULTISPECIES: outer membrane lipid asymmetry maintenance protein MlaD [Acetobacteraceae]|uniref:ABC transporter substrate binding protein n=1 Tax=Parasaccharibacter apium TaxID=1510841 RepID=A0A7U7J0M6_9PROT|nr:MULTISPECIES: outer membrane lipid asymmetry maintenance protein MlaD [Acetobacteraceae]MCT6813663.1 outer membrane lipid asymmetry maintenance protein MlaD [Bombella apis]MCT6820128.1 outer membrane lipid asymmetry maintenance protein MlaD [Bombella apis]MCT6845889.1 outer membrane lipid asymmetry maintenance protein MlaD [Bombella apis]CDG33484.1 ABC transporter substrate binding protein [Parasaccharibacter apium]
MASDNAGYIAARRAGRERMELLVGLVAAAALVVLVVLALVGRQHPQDSGYPLHAAFGHVDGLSVGSDVRLAGVTVGHVRSMQVDPHTFQANVVFSVASDIHLPVDSGAIITSDSLLGGKYVALTPGGDTAMLAPDGTIGETQGAISLEQLLSKFIFSVTDSLQKKAAPAAQPAAASAAVPEPAPGAGQTSP